MTGKIKNSNSAENEKELKNTWYLKKIIIIIENSSTIAKHIRTWVSNKEDKMSTEIICQPIKKTNIEKRKKKKLLMIKGRFLKWGW